MWTTNSSNSKQYKRKQKEQHKQQAQQEQSKQQRTKKKPMPHKFAGCLGLKMLNVFVILFMGFGQTGEAMGSTICDLRHKVHEIQGEFKELDIQYIQDKIDSFQISAGNDTGAEAKGAAAASAAIAVWGKGSTERKAQCRRVAAARWICKRRLGHIRKVPMSQKSIELNDHGEENDDVVGVFSHFPHR